MEEGVWRFRLGIFPDGLNQHLVDKICIWIIKYIFYTASMVTTNARLLL